MNIQKSYQQAYKARKRLDWVADSPFGDFSVRMHLEGTFGVRLNDEALAIFKRRFPRLKKFNAGKFPPEELDSLKAKWQRRALAYLEVKKRQYRLLENWLNAYAAQVELSADWQVCHTCNFSTYRSQTNCTGYTEGACKIKAIPLTHFGVPFKVVAYVYDWEGHLPGTVHGIYLVQDGDGITPRAYAANYPWVDTKRKHADGFALYAPVANWQLDAADRALNLPLYDWAVACWRTNVNPAVLYPFIDQEVLDKSMAAAMRRT